MNITIECNQLEDDDRHSWEDLTSWMRIKIRREQSPEQRLEESRKTELPFQWNSEGENEARREQTFKTTSDRINRFRGPTKSQNLPCRLKSSVRVKQSAYVLPLVQSVAFWFQKINRFTENCMVRISPWNVRLLKNFPFKPESLVYLGHVWTSVLRPWSYLLRRRACASSKSFLRNRSRAAMQSSRAKERSDREHLQEQTHPN